MTSNVNFVAEYISRLDFAIVHIFWFLNLPAYSVIWFYGKLKFIQFMLSFSVQRRNEQNALISKIPTKIPCKCLEMALLMPFVYFHIDTPMHDVNAFEMNVSLLIENKRKEKKNKNRNENQTIQPIPFQYE